MKNAFLLLLSVLISFLALAQAPAASPEQVVQAQLEAYNNKDIDAFMAVFHEEASIWVLGENKPIAAGKPNVRKLYETLFRTSPSLFSTVINRTVIGGRVIDYELIGGRNDSDELLKLVMIYEVRDGTIVRAWSLRE